MKKDFVPSTDEGKVAWATKLKEKVQLYGADLGLTPAEITAVVADCDAIINAVNLANSTKGIYDNAVQSKNLTVKSKVANTRNFAKDLKRKPDYTDAIGKEMGLVMEGAGFDASQYKPKLAAKNYPGHVKLSFTKKGAEGVNLFARIKGSGEWVKLGYFLYSPVDDSRPLVVANKPESREYMCIGVKKDHEVGYESDIVSVTFGG